MGILDFIGSLLFATIAILFKLFFAILYYVLDLTLSYPKVFIPVHICIALLFIYSRRNSTYRFSSRTSRHATEEKFFNRISNLSRKVKGGKSRLFYTNFIQKIN